MAVNVSSVYMSGNKHFMPFPCFCVLGKLHSVLMGLLWCDMLGVGFLIFLGASKVFEFYTEDYADTMSLAVFLISLAVSVYFAEPIRVVIPINLLLLLILVHIVYVLIRWYVKGCKRSRGYY